MATLEYQARAQQGTTTAFIGHRARTGPLPLELLACLAVFCSRLLGRAQQVGTDLEPDSGHALSNRARISLPFPGSHFHVAQGQIRAAQRHAGKGLGNTRGLAQVFGQAVRPMGWWYRDRRESGVGRGRHPRLVADADSDGRLMLKLQGCWTALVSLAPPRMDSSQQAVARSLRVRMTRRRDATCGADLASGHNPQWPHDLLFSWV